MSAFQRLYSGLDREGPGLAEDVHWALDRLGIGGAARVCDAGCGSGADTATLGAALPDARIEAVEQMAHLADEARERCAGLGNVAVHTADMAELSGPFDLIWSAGAIYFLGVTDGLTAWKPALAPGGAVAFSQAVRMVEGDAHVERFWADYPALTDLDGVFDQSRAAGYDVIDHRLILGAPWVAYYRSLAARILALSGDPDPELQAVLAASWTEITHWRAAPDRIAYALVLARPA